MVWEGTESTCTGGANSSRWFDSHVVPSETGPKEPQHQTHTSQRLYSLQAIPRTQPRCSSVIIHMFSYKVECVQVLCYLQHCTYT